MLTVTDITSESFSIRASANARQMVLKLGGTGDLAAVGPLKECLTQVRSDVEGLALDRVQVDIRGLYLLNSSCIKTFVRFVYLIQTEGPPCTVDFQVNPNLGWQARALAPLQRMAPDIVTITER